MALDWSSVDKDYSVVVLMDGAQRVGKRDIERTSKHFSRTTNYFRSSTATARKYVSYSLGFILTLVVKRTKRLNYMLFDDTILFAQK